MSVRARGRLDGRVALVTGAGGGIGRASALALAEAGAAVAVTDIDGGAAERVAAEISDAGGQATAQVLDITREDQIGAVIPAVAAQHGGLHVLVNNAGGGARVAATEMEADRWRAVLEMNMTGTFLCAREAAKIMRAGGGGAIVNMSSIMGLVGGGLYPNAAYQASKGGVVNLTRTLALEWAADGIRVNAVAPTFARTALTTALLSDVALEQEILDNTPMRRLVEPEEVAAAVLFLASDAASMITGHTLPVDGGWTAR